MRYQANPVKVDAFKITSVGPREIDGGVPVWTDDGKNRKATKEMTSRYTPTVGDYWVIQSDGYEYVNPKDVFERKYSVLKEPQ